MNFYGYVDMIESAKSFPAWNKALAYMILEKWLPKYKCVLFYIRCVVPRKWQTWKDSMSKSNFVLNWAKFYRNFQNFESSFWRADKWEEQWFAEFKSSVSSVEDVEQWRQLSVDLVSWQWDAVDWSCVLFMENIHIILYNWQCIYWHTVCPRREGQYSGRSQYRSL